MVAGILVSMQDRVVSSCSFPPVSLVLISSTFQSLLSFEEKSMLIVVIIEVLSRET